MNNKTRLRIQSGVLDPLFTCSAVLVPTNTKQLRERPASKFDATKYGALLRNTGVSLVFIYERILFLLYGILDPINETQTNNE
jgi:hypothetical protein